MVYVYRCDTCNHDFEVVKSHTLVDQVELCAQCLTTASRIYLPNPNLIKRSGLTNDAEYNPAFGQVIKNKRHRKYEAEKRGLVEVGNDYSSGDSMQKHFEQAREIKREKEWEKL